MISSTHLRNASVSISCCISLCVQTLPPFLLGTSLLSFWRLLLRLQAWGLQNRSEDMNNMRFQTKPLETRTLLVPTRYSSIAVPLTHALDRLQSETNPLAPHPPAAATPVSPPPRPMYTSCKQSVCCCCVVLSRQQLSTRPYIRLLFVCVCNCAQPGPTGAAEMLG